MRILHLVHQFAPDHVGGTEIYTETLARRQLAAGHRVAVFTRAPGTQPRLTSRNPGGLPLYRWEAPPASPVGELRTLMGAPEIEAAFAGLLDMLRPELLHVQHLKGLPAPLLAAARDRGARVVLTLHDYWLACANAQLLTNYDGTLCDGPLLWLNCARCAAARLGRPELTLAAPALAAPLALRARRLGALHPLVDRFIAPSSFVAQTMARLGLPPTRIETIRHGIEPPAPAIEPVAGDGGPLRALYVGGLAPQKGVHVAVEAATGAGAERVTLDVYGDPHAFPEYVAGLRAAAGHNVLLRGPLARGELWSRLARADVLLVPSLWHESAGLVVQEALAARLPVFASRIGALPEAVEEDHTGRLLPPGDVAAWRGALETLAADPAPLARWHAAIGPVRTIDQHAADIEALYHRVLDEPPPAARG